MHGRKEEKVNIENYYRRFRNQFKDSQWETLNSNLEFKALVAGDDFDKAMELAGRILIGETKSMSKARKMKKRHDAGVELMDALKAHNCISGYSAVEGNITPEWKEGGTERALRELAKAKPFGLKKIHRTILFEVLPETEREKIYAAFLDRCRPAN